MPETVLVKFKKDKFAPPYCGGDITGMEKELAEAYVKAGLVDILKTKPKGIVTAAHAGDGKDSGSKGLV